MKIYALEGPALQLWKWVNPEIERALKQGLNRAEPRNFLQISRKVENLAGNQIIVYDGTNSKRI